MDQQINQELYEAIIEARAAVVKVADLAKEGGRWDILPKFVGLGRELANQERVFSLIVKEEQSNAAKSGT